jgi:dTDP-4-dehydrorhamnose reductase
MNNCRVLILGASGMAGHMIAHELQQTGRYSVVGTALSGPGDWLRVDVRNPDALAEVISAVNPNVIINAVGALIAESNSNPANAIRLNAVLPHELVSLANDFHAKLVHISTDCVFSGKHGNYAVGAFRDADDIYGRSKALGEITSPPHVTLRTSIVGPELRSGGNGLLAWFLRQTGIIRGYTNALWSGVTTLELALAVQKTIDVQLDGLLHVTNGTPISKYELLWLFKKYFPNNVKDIVPDPTFVTDKSLQISHHFDFKIPTYESMVTALANHPLSRY